MYFVWNIELHFADFSLLTLTSSKTSFFCICYCSCGFCSVGFELHSFFNQRCYLDLELKYKSQKNDFVKLVNTCPKSVITPLDIILVPLLHTWDQNLSTGAWAILEVRKTFHWTRIRWKLFTKRFAQYVSW